MIKTGTITSIMKRDGRTVFFEESKIADAIFMAAKQVGGEDRELAEKLASEVSHTLISSGSLTPTVEEVQDAVEKILIENGHAKTAKAYILYRSQRTRVRNMNTKLMKTFEDLTFQSAADNDIKRENANIDGDTAMGTMLKYGSEGSKQFYELFVIDPKHSAAHNRGDIHIHDLDFYALTTTCTQIDLVKLFKNGFSTGHGFLREPNHIQTYSALACIAIQSNQNDQHGGQSVPNFDYAMAPGVTKTYGHEYKKSLINVLEMMGGLSEEEGSIKVKAALKNIKDKAGIIPMITINSEFTSLMVNEFIADFSKDEFLKFHVFAEKTAYRETDRLTYKAMVALIHNLNTMHSRAGAQIPFSSLNYGTDTSPEGRMVMKNLLLSTEAGLGNGETPIFPIQIFKVKEGINYNKEDINYDLFKLSCRVSAKRLFPNFSFLDAPFNKQYYVKGDYDSEVAYMGCRTRVMANIHKGYEKASGRGNLSFTSINLPRIAIESNGDINRFYRTLDDRMDLVSEQLLDRLKIQASKEVKNYPFLMGQGIWKDSEELSFDDNIAEVLKHGTLTIGFIGLAESLKVLTGKHHGESESSQELGLEIISFMRKKTDEATEKHKLNFSLIASPAEGLSGRFVGIDKEKFGVIPGVTDRDYYTNSFHVPVYYDINAAKKIQTEAPYHELTNGGHISYVEVDGDPTKNLDAFEKIIRHMKDSGVGYGSINHPVDRDPVCGFTGIIGEACPKCGRFENDGNGSFNRIRRITGYLVGTLDRFNNAKKAEEHDRVKHFSTDK